MKIICRAFLFVLVCGATLWAFAIPPSDTFSTEEHKDQLARLIVFHLPCAFAATLALLVGSGLSFASVRTRRLEWDVRAAAAMELCCVLCCLTMLTGILFSKAQWGAWWHWDPRQTSFLIVLLIVAAYLALRLAFPDEQKRAQHSGTYVVASLLPNLFLIFVYPRIPSLGSFHPSNTVAGGGFGATYWSAIFGVFAAVVGVSYWIYRLRSRAGLLELALENMDGNLAADLGGPAPTGVVRPVSLPDDGVAKG